jgi:hypothetical protein
MDVAGLLVDHDFHPDEPSARLFRTALIEQGRLLPWLNELALFQRCQPPAALPARRTSVPDRLRPGHRRTW